MRCKAICVLVGLVLLTVPANAESRSYGWTGLYWGAQAGTALWDASLDAAYTSNDSVRSNFLLPLSYNDSISLSGSDVMGAEIGLLVGANAQLSRNWLIGLQVDASISGGHIDLKGSARGGGTPGQVASTSNSAVAELSADWNVSLLARLGYLVGPDLLAYGLIGATATEVAWNNFDGSGSGASIDSHYTGTELASGLTFGGGLEYRFAPQWSVRTEYRYTSFSGINDQRSTVERYDYGRFGKVTTQSNSKVEADFNVHSFRAALTYNFALR